MQDFNENVNLPQGLKKDVNADITQPYYQTSMHWTWGFTPSAEIWNGRLAMIGFLSATIIEIATGNGYLRFLGLLAGNNLAQ